ncbi:MAG: tetratricopeptide repeat-containing protein [Variovorax sp.]|nr:MAG: tetratricopeptide repeat-containing protein [Variovorax sp.]
MARLFLAMASECRSRGPLTGLRSVAEGVVEAMLDRDRGDCHPLQVSGQASSGFIFNPTASGLIQAVDEVLERIRDQVLVFYWIGHGQAVARYPSGAEGAGFYLIPSDAGEPECGDASPGVELGPLLGRIKAAEPRGVIVVLDACQSGVVTEEALAPWLAGGGDVSFLVLTSTRDDAAWDLGFTRAFTGMLHHGLGSPGNESLSAMEINGRVGEIARQQTSALLLHNNAPDPPDLWLSRNVAFARKSSSHLPEEHAENLVLTEAVRAVVGLRDQSNLALVGDAGSGKTTLSAMLVRLPAQMRRSFGVQHLIDAAVFANTATTAGDVIRAFNVQLCLHREFREATKDANTRTDLRTEEDKLLSALRHWMRPLASDPDRPPRTVTVLLDSLDSLPGTTLKRTLALIDALVQIRGVRVITSARPGTRLPTEALVHHIGRAEEPALRDYMTRRGVEPALHEVLVKRSGGLWVCAYAFTEHVRHRSDWQPHELEQLSLDEAFRARLESVGVGGDAEENEPGSVSVVFAVLAAAGSGAVMPVELLRLACAEQLPGFSDEHHRSALGGLRGLTERSGIDTPNEHLGLFHQELVGHARREFKGPIDVGHKSILGAIEASGELKYGTPVWRYAFSRAAEHLYQLGRFEAIVPMFRHFESSNPRENLDRAAVWLPRLIGQLGADHEHALTTRHNIADWTGQTGDLGGALVLFKALLADQIRVLGAHHPDVLSTRSNIASLTGQTGDLGGALVLSKALLADETRVLGADHPGVLITRSNIGSFTGETGGVGGALVLFKALLADQTRVLGADHPHVLKTRSNIAHWTGETGDLGGALALFKALLADHTRVLGADHPDVLSTRHNVASWTGETGDVGGALTLFKALVADQTRVLGADHPHVLIMRHNIAGLTFRTGDVSGALVLSKALLADQTRVLGADHPHLLITLNNIASLTGETGDLGGALVLFKALLADRIRVLGAHHPDVLLTRHNIAHWTGQNGDVSGALVLSKALLADQTRVLGADHPRVLVMRHNIASLTVRTGDVSGALVLSKALLADQTRVLGANHPHVLSTRSNIAQGTGQAGDGVGALDLFRALLPDLRRVFGADHPRVVALRRIIVARIKEQQIEPPDAI